MLTAIGGIGFTGWAFVSFLFGAPSIFLAILGLQLFLFALIFGGFAILFLELRNILREHWLNWYASSRAPHSIPADEIKPVSSSISRVVD